MYHVHIHVCIYFVSCVVFVDFLIKSSFQKIFSDHKNVTCICMHAFQSILCNAFLCNGLCYITCRLCTWGSSVVTIMLPCHLGSILYCFILSSYYELLLYVLSFESMVRPLQNRPAAPEYSNRSFSNRRVISAISVNDRDPDSV